MADKRFKMLRLGDAVAEVVVSIPPKKRNPRGKKARKEAAHANAQGSQGQSG